MRLFCFFLLILSLAPASEPQAASPSINDSGTGFLEVCKHVEQDYNPHDSFNNGVCIGWLQGFAQGSSIAEEFSRTPADKKRACPPGEVTTIQLFRIIKKHIDDHPERAHLAARYLVSEALIKAFPCQK